MNLPFDINLKGKCIVFTGGGGAIGTTLVRALAASGGSVAVITRHQESADKAADKAGEEGGQTIGIAADVLDAQQLRNAKQLINDRFGAVDILVNGAGGNHPDGTTSRDFLDGEDMVDPELKTFFDLNEEGVRYVFDLNFLGTLLPVKIFAPDMRGRPGSVIINLSSMAAFTPLTRIPAYSGAKAAINNFTQWLAVNFSREKIRVNAIAPGFFLGEQNRALLTEADGSYSERGKKIISQTPMGRFGNYEELIGTLLWLIDERSSGFVNGAVIPVDGGFSAYSGV